MCLKFLIWRIILVLCSYNCGNVGLYKFKNGNLCCSKSVNQCPSKRFKDLEAKQGKFNGTPFWKIPDYVKIAWNKGLNKDNDDRIKNISIKLKGRILGTRLPPDSEKEKERRLKISNTMKSNPNAGGIREGSGRGIKQWYCSDIAGNVYIRSSYELEYVKWLDSNNINWKPNLDKFPYIYNEKLSYYYPDFYLIDDDIFIEIKGYATERDIAKWGNFPYKLKILFKSDLQTLGLNIK